MAQNIFLINIEPPEMRIAEVRDNKLFDLSIERSGRLLGDVFRGVVMDIVPGMDAAFVNIGLARNALMYAGDVMQLVDPLANDRVKPIQELLRVGDEITVQVVRPPVGTKGARITGRASLSGRFVVMNQGSENVGVSKRIEDEKERVRLRRIAEKLRPFDKGIIMRSEAFGASEIDISRDIDWLEQQMQMIIEHSKKKVAPAAVHRELGLLGRLVRDRLNQSVSQILIDSKDEYEILVELAQKITPQFANRISLYADKLPLFDRYGLNDDFINATKRRVSLPHGGTLVIDENEALCTIDVNTAHFTGKTRLADTILTTNLEAAVEACRQLRLRDIGGIIVIDFIDMMRNRDRITVFSELEKAVKEDHTRTRIVQISPSGLVELSRQRENVSLRHLRNKPCSCCNGDGVVQSPVTIGIEARRQLRSLASQDEISKAAITLFPEAACAMLANEKRWTTDFEKSTNMEISLRADAAFDFEAIDIQPNMLAEIPSCFKVGAQIAISSHTALYPVRAPQFLLHMGMLVELEDFSYDSKETKDIPRPAIIEITECGQLSCVAKVVTFHS
ncbi:MAG: Rne/Rng family ribonuclease [Abditibacteriaceae bacterium]